MDALQNAISEGRTVAQFLAEPVIEEVLQRLERDYVNRWKASDNAQEREALHAKARAIDDLRTDLRAVVDSGTRATAELLRKRDR